MATSSQHSAQWAGTRPATTFRLHPGWRRLLWCVGIVLLVLLVVQLAGSPIATRMANRRLAAMPQFTGQVGSVRLELWRGTVTVRDLVLTDRAHPEDGPVVIAPKSVLSIAWAPLLRGRIGGDADIDRAQVIMVKRAETAQDEKEKAEKLAKPVVRAWQEVLAKEFPVELRKIEIKDSQLRFDDRSDPQAVSLALDGINLTATGFSNREKGDDPLPAKVKLDARMADGTLAVDAQADPAERLPRFEVKLEVKGVSLPAMHDFLVRYALIDVQSGQFDLYSEISAADGSFKGYTKPFFKDLKFEAVPDPEKNLLQRAATKVASMVQDALKNESGDVATKAPFEGNFEDNQVDVWTTLENLLRNAFIQALREGLEGQTETPAAKS
jgi:hypothetical protein